MLVTSIFCFSKNVFYSIIERNHYFRYINSFPNKPWFLHVSCTSLLKTLWENEKLFIVSISPFSAVLSPCLKNFLPFSSNQKLSSANLSVWKRLKFVVWERLKYSMSFANAFNLDQHKILLFGKQLTLYKRGP